MSHETLQSVLIALAFILIVVQQVLFSNKHKDLVRHLNISEMLQDQYIHELERETERHLESIHNRLNNVVVVDVEKAATSNTKRPVKKVAAKKAAVKKAAKKPVKKTATKRK